MTNENGMPHNAPLIHEKPDPGSYPAVRVSITNLY